MSYEDFTNCYGITLSDSEAREYIKTLFENYNLSREKCEDDYILYNEIPINIIALYVNYIKSKNFNVIYGDYKSKYILNESLVEPGVTEEEKLGLGCVYDYISSFNEGTDINLFIESFKLHNLLYSCCPFPEFGSSIRTEEVYLFDTPYDVVSGSQVVFEFNKYLGVNISKNVDDDLFDYIDKCITLTIDLIKLQPFMDGNKRTFRGLLNLLLKKVGIPPIYITI